MWCNYSKSLYYAYPQGSTHITLLYDTVNYYACSVIVSRRGNLCRDNSYMLRRRCDLFQTSCSEYGRDCANK